jgi:transcriptional regulator with XRE-family HTH domain
MTQQLRERLTTYLIKHGPEGKRALANGADCSLRTIDRWMSGETVPNEHDRFNLAVACGCSEDEALELARTGEAPSMAKETA